MNQSSPVELQLAVEWEVVARKNTAASFHHLAAAAREIARQFRDGEVEWPQTAPLCRNEQIRN